MGRRKEEKEGSERENEGSQEKMEAEKGGSRINENLTHAKFGMERVHPVVR